MTNNSIDSAPLRAVIFDMDGTLLYTLEDIAMAGNRALCLNGFPEHPVDAYRMFIGSGARTLMIRALPEGVRDDSELVDRCLQGFLDDYGLNWNVLSKLYPGMGQLLDSLADRGIPMAVLTNKPHTAALKCAEELLGQWTFAVVQGQEKGFPIKPDPSGALRIAKTLNVPPQEVLYVGDSAVDMETARSAGMIAAGVLWGYRDREELVGAGAQYLVEDPMELLGFV